MRSAPVALAFAAAAIALVAAPFVDPYTALYHTWQYALALTIALVVMLAYARDALRGRQGARGKRFLLALAGAALAIGGGLASGLLGPDTSDVAGSPGTVVPIPALGAAAFFGAADANAIARGSAGVTLRRRNGAAIAISPGGHRLAGESLLFLEPRVAAYVDVTDDRGAHLTITQPSNASFLSPVLLFPQRQRIGAFDVPLDTFAAPARHRIVRALYFTAEQLAQAGHGSARDRTEPALVLTASDDAGRSLGIVLAANGRDVEIGGIRVRATLGTYPALAIASVPPAWTLVLGAGVFVAGVVWGALRSG